MVPFLTTCYSVFIVSATLIIHFVVTDDHWTGGGIADTHGHVSTYHKYDKYDSYDKYNRRY